MVCSGANHRLHYSLHARSTPGIAVKISSSEQGCEINWPQNREENYRQVTHTQPTAPERERA